MGTNDSVGTKTTVVLGLASSPAPSREFKVVAAEDPDSPPRHRRCISLNILLQSFEIGGTVEAWFAGCYYWKK